MTLVHLIEDDPSFGTTLGTALRSRGWLVRVHPTLAEARASLASETPDLVLLDLGLPDGDGLEVCRTLRAAGSRVPILVLTARGTLESRLSGFREGADDYLVKPFDLDELEARCKALLRRARAGERPGPVRIGRLEVDFEARRARRGGRPVELTEIEFQFLSYLLARAGDVLSREDLLRDVWKMPGCQSRTVDTFVGRIRKLIERDPSRPRHLATVRGVGYRLSP